jgi:uncharacterized membrane protein
MLADIQGLLVALIEFAAALLIVRYCALALVELIRTRNPIRVRLLVIEGALWGLSLKTAASLLKTIEMHSWTQIAAFAAILALRTVLRRVMTWEQHRLLRSSDADSRRRLAELIRAG